MTSKFYTRMRRICFVVLSVLLCSTVALQPVSAVNQFYMMNNVQFEDPEDGTVCTTSNDSIVSAGTDYQGKAVLTAQQSASIKANQPIYEQAADEFDIPWQMIAVIHLRETGLAKNNPSNGQGVYQFLNKNGGPYPTGPVDDTEFLRQTKVAAEFIKGKAGSNLDANKNLTKTSGADAIKDTLFSYNGRSSKYAAQAAAVGFDSATQPYEGSPYVMNRADEKRDPSVNQSTWGQVKTDGGPIAYPANNDYGAFVIYAAIAGIQGTGCSSDLKGSVREKVATIAAQELQAWNNNQLKNNGSDFHKYTHGGHDNWCAWFASWVYKEAGYPLNNSSTGAVPAVQTIMEIGKAGDKFVYNPKAGYTPKVGDMTIYKQNGASHVNIVTAVASDGKVTIIGGNQGFGSGGQATSFRNSSVTEYSFYVNDVSDISGFVSPKE